MTPVDHALAVAARGLPVFPCAKDTKAPLVGADRDDQGRPIPKTGGLYKATTDADQIRRWWKKWPDAMIGVPMGRASGLFAIDCDRPKRARDPDGVENFKALCAERGWRIQTHAVVTPSGGRHFVFRLPPDRLITNSPGALAGLGIDVRGEGGYVIWEGSAR